MKNKRLQENLLKIKHSLDSGTYVQIEKEWLELKSLATGGDLKSLKESVCAFLNTKGGVVIGGISENDSGTKYHVTGFNQNSESNIIALRQNVFKGDNGRFPDLSDYISFEYDDTTFSKTIIVMYIENVPDDLKYLSFNDKVYERVLTQDKVISESKLRMHIEYKQEIEFAKEITTIPNAAIQDLSIDKINAYINLFNREIQKESLKATLEDARPFLERQHFKKDEAITTLGMLVCGSEPFVFLENRVEVDCYYDTGENIAKDKKYFRNDVINLMNDVFMYVWGNIKVGRSSAGGGTNEPEYPEGLIREVLNNALAHRDYSQNKFITVVIKPNDCLEIKNPGKFKDKMIVLDTKSDMQVRRIIPGIPETKNPKLASVLKVFEKIESRGMGMATLVNDCLADKIDVPYYELSMDDSITLRIPSGRLFDEAGVSWLNSFDRYIKQRLGSEPTVDHKAVLLYLFKSEKYSESHYYSILLSESNNHHHVINDLKTAGIIQEHPSSSELAPVYILNRALVKTTFPELLELFGIDYETKDAVSKQILDIIYRYNTYNEEPVSARKISPEIYASKIGKFVDIKKYETLSRKVRVLCQGMTKKQMLIKEPKGYRINLEFKKPHTLFNA